METDRDKPEVIHKPKKKKKPVKPEESDDKEVDVRFIHSVNVDGFCTCIAQLPDQTFLGKSAQSHGEAKSNARMMAQKYLDRPATTVEKMTRSRNGTRT